MEFRQDKPISQSDKKADQLGSAFFLPPHPPSKPGSQLRTNQTFIKKDRLGKGSPHICRDVPGAYGAIRGGFLPETPTLDCLKSSMRALGTPNPATTLCTGCHKAAGDGVCKVVMASRRVINAVPATPGRPAFQIDELV